MIRFNSIFLFCLSLKLILFSGALKAQEVSIKGQFHLSGKLDYQFEILNPNLKSIEKQWRLEPTLQIEVTSVGDSLVKKADVRNEGNISPLIR